MQIEPENLYPDCSVIVRTIPVGGLAKRELMDELRRNSVQWNAYAERLFADDRFTTSEASTLLTTVEVTVGDLGFPKGTTTEPLFQRARDLGLELCPLELGPCLRLQYLDQPEGFWITIASQKISPEDGYPNGFYLRRREDGLWLRGYWASPDHIWEAGEHFVFVKEEVSQT
jgi:hypothetical protein